MQLMIITTVMSIYFSEYVKPGYQRIETSGEPEVTIIPTETPISSETPVETPIISQSPEATEPLGKLTKEKVSVKIKDKKIVKVVKRKLKAKKLTVIVKGKRKGRTVLTVTVGKKRCKVRLAVS